MKDITNNTVLIDATGVNCPVPLMMLKQAVDQLDEGGVILIEVTDQHAELDFEIWCEKFEHTLMKLNDDSGKLRFKVIKNKL